MKTLNVMTWVSCLWIGLGTIGCGDGDTLKRVSVTGQVTVGGSEPFQNGRVIFEPAGGAKKGKTQPLGGSATTDEEGKYVLMYNNKAGIEAGNYKVYFTLYTLPDGSPLPDQTGEEHPKSVVELGAVNIVPPEYATTESTKNPTTVPETGGTFDFDIPKLKALKK